ncbi:hypothetical protein JEQ12_000778 [Ovis aries]|uniref:Uncharacterized protein n=1 Tax=Ovis aries TaxID=9940 RepID=A0A836AP58_SHEEP|nr:hypothetical protein JEQ12_000778 [Ovis aries]
MDESAVTRIRAEVAAATTQSTNHYTITARHSSCRRRSPCSYKADVISFQSLRCCWTTTVEDSQSCRMLTKSRLKDEKTKPNRKPILTSPDLARFFWEVGLSSFPPRQLLSWLFAFVPYRPSPPAGSSSCPTDRGR